MLALSVLILEGLSLDSLAFGAFLLFEEIKGILHNVLLSVVLLALVGKVALVLSLRF